MRVETSRIPRIGAPLFALCIGLPLMAQTGTDAASTTAGTDIPMSEIYGLLAVAGLQLLIILALNSILRRLATPGIWSDRLKGGAKRALVLLPLLMLISGQARAQAYQGATDTMPTSHVYWWSVAVNCLLFLVILVQLDLLRSLVRTVVGVAEEERPKPVTVREGPSWATRMLRKLSDRAPIEKEQDILLDHDYDGIRELDNVLPPWWLWLFYGSIIFAVVYLMGTQVFHVWPGQQEEYRQEMAQASADVVAYRATLKNNVDENNVTLSSDPTILAAGKATFIQNCTPCHGADAAGSENSVGPNLTDAYWLHGGGIKNVFHTITYGVPEKGMISWKTQLKPVEIAAVASYVLSLQGTGPSTQKAPQGDLWTEAPATSDSTAVPADSSQLTP